LPGIRRLPLAVTPIPALPDSLAPLREALPPIGTPAPGRPIAVGAKILPEPYDTMAAPRLSEPFLLLDRDGGIAHIAVTAPEAVPLLDASGLAIALLRCFLSDGFLDKLGILLPEPAKYIDDPTVSRDAYKDLDLQKFTPRPLEMVTDGRAILIRDSQATPADFLSFWPSDITGLDQDRRTGPCDGEVRIAAHLAFLAEIPARSSHGRLQRRHYLDAWSDLTSRLLGLQRCTARLEIETPA